MKKTALLFLVLSMLPAAGCRHDPPGNTGKLDKALQGLNKLTLTPREESVVLSLIRDSADLDFPVYSLQGERLTTAQIREKEMNVAVDGYGESLTNLHAVVLRDMTPAEREKILKEVEEQGELVEKQLESLENKPAPVFSAQDIQGKTVDLAALKGKVVALNFWFIHCAACLQEMPELNRLKRELSGKDVVFIGLTFDKAAETRAFLKRRKFDYRIVAEAQSIFDLYGVEPCPTNVVIDRAGQVVYAGSGYIPFENQSYNNLKNAINRALEE